MPNTIIFQKHNYISLSLIKLLFDQHRLGKYKQLKRRQLILCFFSFRIHRGGSSSLKRGGGQTSNKTVIQWNQHQAKLVSEEGCVGCGAPRKFLLKELISIKSEYYNAQNRKILLQNFSCKFFTESSQTRKIQILQKDRIAR